MDSITSAPVDPKSDPLLLDYLNNKRFFLFEKSFLTDDELLSSYKRGFCIQVNRSI